MTAAELLASTSPDVSAVVCSYNAEASIIACLKSLRRNCVREIILVDASSTDRTRELAGPYADRIITDPRAGLGTARNMGIRETTGAYILNCGVDNVMPDGSIDAMIRFKEAGQYAAVSAMTSVQGDGYIAWALDRYKRARFFSGVRAVIGTPTLFDGPALRSSPYNPSSSFSDDAELCERWASQFGSQFAISDVIVYEIGSTDASSVRTRWKGYGRSDYEIFSSHSAEWTVWRKVRSLMYPFMQEFALPFLRIRGTHRFAVLPFLLWITMVRYAAWYRSTR